MNPNDPTLPPTYVSRFSNWLDRQRAPKKFAMFSLLTQAAIAVIANDRAMYPIFMCAFLIVIVIPCEKQP